MIKRVAHIPAMLIFSLMFGGVAVLLFSVMQWEYTERKLATDKTLPLVEARVTDFGIVTGNELPSNLMAAPYCVSPEMIAGRAQTPECDQYSLGCVMYWMLTGEPPFAERTSREVMDAHLRKIYTPLLKIDPLFGVEIDRIVTRLLQRKASDRYKSMQDVVQAMEQLAGKQKKLIKKKTAPIANVQTTSTAERLARSGQRNNANTMLYGLIGVTIVLVLVTVYYFIQSVQPDRGPEILEKVERLRYDENYKEIRSYLNAQKDYGKKPEIQAKIKAISDEATNKLKFAEMKQKAAESFGKDWKEYESLRQTDVGKAKEYARIKRRNNEINKNDEIFGVYYKLWVEECKQLGID